MVQEHFLAKVFSAAEEDIRHVLVLLNDAPQAPFDQVALIFQHLLNLIKNDHDFPLPPRPQTAAAFELSVQSCHNILKRALAESGRDPLALIADPA